jgi:hypothetical protein
MKAFFEYIGSILITVLPPRYRSSTHLRGPAMTCGIAQTVLMIAILAIRLVLFSREADVLQQSGLTPEIIYEAAGRLGERGAYGSGIFLVVNFITRPLNAFILYLALEGIVRAMAALVGHQVIGSLPFYAISGIHDVIDKRKYRRYVGEVLPDQVVRGTGKQQYDLKVYSSRPKLHWNPYMTIEFEEKFYHYFKEEYGPAPRRFVYYLRNNPTGRLVVVIDRYKP